MAILKEEDTIPEQIKEIRQRDSPSTEAPPGQF